MVRLLQKIFFQLKKLGSIVSDGFYRRALYHGSAAGVEHERILRLLNCDTVVDIGANRGQFALVARKCFPKAQIISFEPLELPTEIYRGVFLKDKNAQLFPFAIGPECGDRKIHISKRDDSSSLLPITLLQDALFPGTAEVTTDSIRIGPLDSFIVAERITKPALLKLDVQGFELSALHGCETLLGNFDYVYAECSFVELYSGQALAHEIIQYLRDRGFDLRGIYNLTYDDRGACIQADFLFSYRAGG